MIRFLSKYKYWVFTWSVFFILRLPSLFEPYWYGDEGIYLTIGQAIRRGLILYQQIHDNKPPTLYYLAALAKTVYGFRLLLALTMVPTIYLFYRLSKKFFSDNLSKISTFLFMVISSIPLIEGNIANAEIFMLLPTIVGFLVFLSSKKKYQFYFSGLLLGLAFTIKIPVFIELFFLIFYFLVVNFAEVKKCFLEYFAKPFLMGIGFLTPTFFYLIYFYLLHALSPFLNAALLQNFSYISSWSTGNQTSSISSGGVVQRLIILLVFLIIFAFLYSKKIINHKFFLILGWFFTCIFGILLSTRPYPHYLIQILPSFCLLFVYLFCNNFFKLDKVLTILSFTFLVFIFHKYNFYFYKNLAYYHNFYSYLFNSSTATNYRDYFGSDVNATYQIADYIKQNCREDEKIFVWGDNPDIYALSNRLPVGRYTVAYHIRDFNGFDQTIKNIQAVSPKFIVYSLNENNAFPQLDDILNRYYFLDQAIQNVLIFQKR